MYLEEGEEGGAVAPSHLAEPHLLEYRCQDYLVEVNPWTEMWGSKVVEGMSWRWSNMVEGKSSRWNNSRWSQMGKG